MKAKLHLTWFATMVFLGLALISPLYLNSQCFLSQGCKPLDNLTYIPNGTGQVYHGDGASNDGSGRWTTNNADFNQCLSCHYGTDTLPYLMTGHKNTMRKFAPGVLWSGPDGAMYSTRDDYYASGSTYDWTNNQVTVGWCMPLATTAQNGLSPQDAACKYPYYTLPNAHAPAPYTPATGGGVRNLFYLYGGWQNYGGTANPAATHLNAIFDGGFTGDIYPKGNFDCARCHATGYNFDHWAPEPTSNLNNKVTWIPDAQFSRSPTDGYVAPGTNGTSSWYLSGIQCERCHTAAWGYGSHPWGSWKPTVPYNEAATSLCMECHRGESIVPANPNATPPAAGSINPASTLLVTDHGYCSDLSGSPYAVCAGNPSNQWIYKPYLDHEAGLSFLNSPHARFNGDPVQNAQHSSDLSITLSGTYGSYFSGSPSDPTKNSGCTACHDPHQSTVAAAGAKKPIAQPCDQCHKLAQTIMSTINHPMGPGTPFPTGASYDVPGACVTCHMQAALGRANSHLFRISTDANFTTFPTPDQFYNQGIDTLGIAPEYSPYSGNTFNHAIWQDVDLACGQCHVGGDGKTNPYGLTLPPGMPGAHAYTKTQLAYWASVMHPPDPTVPVPAFSPAPGVYHSPQTITISDAQPGATIYYTTDGTLPNRSSSIYSGPISISANTAFRAFATYPGLPESNNVLDQYSILLPQAPPPTFWPTPSLFSSPQSVKLSNTLNLPMYYTLDGSPPTVNSAFYGGPILVTKNTTISAITAAYGYTMSPVSSGTYQIQAPNPAISPSSGTYYSPVNVTISDTVSGATIYYTTNGSFPSTNSTSCANPCTFKVSTTATVKAIASGGGYAASNVAVATFTIAANNPTFAPGSGTYSKQVSVTITDSTPGVTIYYSTTGFPTTSSPSCASPCTVTLSSTTILRSMAAGPGISQSGVTVATYTITP